MLPKNSKNQLKPDIALFIGTLEGGGAERLQLILAKYFLSKGLRVDFVVAKNIGSLKDQVPSGARLVSLDAKRLMLCFPAYLRYLHLARPKVVLSSVERPNIIACLAKFFGSPKHCLIARADGPLVRNIPLWRDVSRWFWLLLVALTYRRADRLIAISAGMQRQLLRLPFVREQAVASIYNPVIWTDFTERMQADCSIPALMDGTPVILAAGRLHPAKDYATLLRAFADVRAQMTCRLVILGEGSLKASLETLARNLGISQDTHFVGFVQNPLPWMRQADVYVMSSAWEGLGNVLIEALATGTPVISTDCPHGPAEVLEHGRFGKLVPVGDPQALAAAILDTLSHPKPPISSELKEHLKQFEIETVGRQYLNLIFESRQGSKVGWVE